MTSMAFRVFSGKIMLFGEYSVIEGSSAALLPYARVQAKLTMPDSRIPDPRANESNLSLKAFAGYLNELFLRKDIGFALDLTRFVDDLDRGIYLESSIPGNYGLGSSGALCAAVFDAYRNPSDPERTWSVKELQKIFSMMESFFHRSSSGVDPLCIYLNEPLVILNGSHLLPGNAGMHAGNETGFFLIDTGQKSQTGPHVQYFRNQMAEHRFNRDFRNKYIPLVNLAAEQWMHGHLQLQTVLEVSDAQLHYFGPMVPDSFRVIWEKGIETGLYACKLCGSGGGGMILCFARDMQGARSFLKKHYDSVLK